MHATRSRTSTGGLWRCGVDTGVLLLVGSDFNQGRVRVRPAAHRVTRGETFRMSRPGPACPFRGRGDRIGLQPKEGAPWRTIADLSRTRSAEVPASEATPAGSTGAPTRRRPSAT